MFREAQGTILKKYVCVNTDAAMAHIFWLPTIDDTIKFTIFQQSLTASWVPTFTHPNLFLLTSLNSNNPADTTRAPAGLLFSNLHYFFFQTSTIY